MTGRAATVLVVDDEPQIRRALRVLLRDAGYAVDEAGTVEAALDRAAVHAPVAAIVDLVLPDGTGIDVCRGLREWSAVPIIVLSAHDDEDGKVAALEAGADDYVTKPFGSREIVARLKALLRRSGTEAEDPVVRVGALDVDLADQTVRRDGDEIRLTRTEFALLRALVRHRGRLLTHQALLLEVWGAAYAEDTATLRTHIANLRRKVEDPSGARIIRTETGVGYRLVA